MKRSLKRNECVRQCRYNFTALERLELGRKLADEYQSLDTTNNDLERIKKDYKARIDAHESMIATLADNVRSGYELRETVCFWDFNKPQDGKKQLKRADTLEVVETADMTEADRQLVMEVVEDAATAQADATGHPNIARALPEKSDITPSDRSTDTPTTPPKPDNTPRRRASGPGVVELDADEGQTGDDEDDRNKI